MSGSSVKNNLSSQPLDLATGAKVSLRLCSELDNLLVQLFFVERREEAQPFAVLVHELNILLAHLQITVIRSIW